MEKYEMVMIVDGYDVLQINDDQDLVIGYGEIQILLFGMILEQIDVHIIIEIRGQFILPHQLIVIEHLHDVISIFG
jgi:hypothetical protein